MVPKKVGSIVLAHVFATMFLVFCLARGGEIKACCLLLVKNIGSQVSEYKRTHVNELNLFYYTDTKGFDLTYIYIYMFDI